ncbi:MAG: rod shape-determining protein MreC [Leeuwenhoekiella sp.]
MQQIINFIIKYKNFLLFVVLWCLALLFTFQTHSYHRSKFVNAANFVSGGIFNNLNNISIYFDLKRNNERLVDENARLRQRLLNLKINDSLTINVLKDDLDFKVIPAQVINNQYTFRNNIITLNSGKRDSINQDMGVITSRGIVGIIDETSRRFSTAVSILNSTIRINAKLKKSGDFGSLTWSGDNPSITQLIDIQQKAPVQKGDTVVTGGMSTIFPEGIGIGTVKEFSLDNTGNYYTIQVKLFNDMTTLDHVYIIDNRNSEEIKTLENLSEDDQ